MPYEEYLVSIVAIFFGYGIGYVLGGSSSLGMKDRVGLGLVVSILGGIILPLMVGTILTISTLTIFITIAAFIGGTALGMVTNWEAPVKRASKSHVIYDLDDDEEFDREIEDAMGDSSKRY